MRMSFTSKINVDLIGINHFQIVDRDCKITRSNDEDENLKSVKGLYMFRCVNNTEKTKRKRMPVRLVRTCRRKGKLNELLRKEKKLKFSYGLKPSYFVMLL